MKRVMRFLLLLILLTDLAGAGKTHFRPLSTVITSDCIIFEATLVAVEKTWGRFSVNIDLEVNEVTGVVGKPPQAGLYRCSIPVPHQRKRDGRKITVSPLSSASGKEFSLKTDSRYLFLSRPGVGLFRVEPLTSREKILELSRKIREDQ